MIKIIIPTFIISLGLFFVLESESAEDGLKLGLPIVFFAYNILMFYFIRKYRNK